MFFRFLTISGVLVSGALANNWGQFDEFYFKKPAQAGGVTVTQLVWEAFAGFPATVRLGSCGTYSNKLYYIGSATGSDTATNAHVFDGTAWTYTKGVVALAGANATALHNGLLWEIAISQGFAWNGTDWLTTNNAGAVALPALGEVTGTLYCMGGGRTDIYRFDETNWVDTGFDVPIVGNYSGGFVISNKLYYIPSYSAGYLTNVYSFDGATVAAVAGLPHAQTWMSPAAAGGNGYWAGGSDSGNMTNVLRFNGTVWTYEAGLPIAMYQTAVGVLGDYIYVVGGAMTNVYRSKWIGAPE